MEQVKLPKGLWSELWSNLPKVVLGAYMASGLGKKTFVKGWANSCDWARARKHPKSAIMSTHSAMELWRGAMGSGFWKGAALVNDVPVKLSPGHSQEARVGAFLAALAEIAEG